MKFWCLEKKVKLRKNKNIYIYYLMLNNNILTKIGYFIRLPKLNIMKVNLIKLFIILFYYKGFFEIKDKIYIKFFILYYFYLLKMK